MDIRLGDFALVVGASAVHARVSSLSADGGRVSVALGVVERAPKVGIGILLVVAWWRVVIIIVRVELSVLLLVRRTVLLLLDLLIDHLLIPHFLVTHLLAHFFLQVRNLFLKAFLNLLLNNSPDKRSQVNWHCLQVLELLILNPVIGLGLLNGNLLLLRRGGDLSHRCLDWNLLLLKWDHFLLFDILQHHLGIGIPVGRLLPEHKEDDPVSELTSSK